METKDPIERLRKFRDGVDRSAMGLHTFVFSAADIAEIVADLEAQYMKLPADSDGVPIRPGDLIESEYMHGPMTVANVGRSDVYAYDEREKGFFVAAVCRHVKPDTVGSLLEDMVKDIASEHVIYVPDDKKEEFCARLRDIRDDYAERIRKAVEE